MQELQENTFTNTHTRGTNVDTQLMKANKMKLNAAYIAQLHMFVKSNI